MQLGVLNSCMYNVEEIAPGCDTTNITFTYTIHPIIIKNCAVPGCHVPGGEGRGDYTTYKDIKEKVDNRKLLQQIYTGKMPKQGTPGPTSLSKCDQSKITQWVLLGAPNN
ncbi:MAG: hypothetical protein IIA88_11600 [Bacteroidetes bacterium]|nr:hypothetical protein [Bacteroidota bacterium]